jgi:lipopolysaccharide transport system permease protein
MHADRRFVLAAGDSFAFGRSRADCIGGWYSGASWPRSSKPIVDHETGPSGSTAVVAEASTGIVHSIEHRFGSVEIAATMGVWREMIGEQIQYRELLMQMIRRDLLLRYKQTIMGFGWAVFMPLVNTAVFSVIFTRVAPLHTPVPYPVFAFCGLWAWNFFASALRFSVTSLTSNSTLVSKVYFPREIFPFAAVFVSVVDFGVGSLVLAAFMLWYHIPVSVHVLWLPVVLAVHIMFTIAVALVLSMGNLFYRDVKYLFEIVITVWMFATPVVYPVDRIGGAIGVVLRMNPMTPIIDAYRAALLLNAPPPPAFVGAAALSAGGCLCAWLLFHRLEFKFAENI